MENSLQVFENNEFGRVRTVLIDGEPWFVGKDVATALGYADTDQALRKHVDTEDKLTRRFDGSGMENDGSGQMRNMNVINESGVYSLIFGSKLPTAKAFKHWVTSEVLPSLHKTGSYAITSANASEVELVKEEAHKELPLPHLVMKELVQTTEVLQSGLALSKLQASLGALSYMEQTLNVSMEGIRKAIKADARAEQKKEVAKVPVPNIDGTLRQQLIAKINDYVRKTGLSYQDAWLKFVAAYNIAYRTNLTTLRNSYRHQSGNANASYPEMLEGYKWMDKAMAVADQLLAKPVEAQTPLHLL